MAARRLSERGSIGEIGDRGARWLLGLLEAIWPAAARRGRRTELAYVYVYARPRRRRPV